mmetsp:Transcript_9740/g.19048  ORF Transcript_9740/g.19048 Transcript_9740/m.19048 type:complete len:223 (-) Transcript_9740:1040-1708(-)
MEEQGKIFNLTQIAKPILLKPVLSLPKLPAPERQSASVLKRSSRVPSTEITIRNSQRSRASSSMRGSKSISMTRLIKPNDLLDEIRREASITIDSLTNRPHSLLAVMQRIERSMNVKDQIETIRVNPKKKGVHTKREECNRLTHTRTANVKQLKQLKENLQYMQMNTSSEINTERLNYLETEVCKIRSVISEEHHYEQVLKHMYQTRHESFMALQKPLNAIR